MHLQDDTYYINKVLGGEIKAYTFLVDRHKRMVYTLALKILSVPEDAEETAQDAFVKAYQSLKDFKGESKFSTWLYTIVYHLSISRLRKKHLNTVSIHDEHFRNFDVGDSDHFLSKITNDEQIGLVRTAIDKLSGDEQALVTLYYINESSVKEISTITGDSESNVKVKLFRVRKRLGELLAHNHHTKISIGHE